MPCYEPPRPDKDDFAELARQRDKHIATLKDIEEQCKLVLDNTAPNERFTADAGARGVAHQVLDIIDTHWGRKPHDKVKETSS